MSLTVTGPGTASFNPANNPIIYTLSSTNTGQANFRYIADVYVNSSPDYNRIEVVANPTYSSGIVDISGIVQSFLSGAAEENTSTFKTNDNHVCSFVIQFGEQYGPSSGVTTYPNITSKSAYAFNGVFDPIEFLAYSDADYIIDDSGSQVLSDCPYFETNTTDRLNISFLNNTTDQGKFIAIDTYDSSGNNIDNIRILNPYNTVNANARRSICIDVGYGWLITLSTSDLALGTAPFLSSTISYYQVKMLDSAGLASSETLTIYVKETCSKSTPVRFKFMNNYGVYEQFTFYGSSRKVADIKRNIFKSNPYTWSASGYSTNSRSRGNTQYETVLSDNVTVQSDWITEEQSAWLEQLVTSPDVYVYEGSNLISVNIVDSNYATRYEASEQLFNLSLSFKYSFNRTRQRR